MVALKQRRCGPKRTVSNFYVELPGSGRLAEVPTDAIPGTEDKLRVMAERFERREGLFHPADARRPLR